MSEKTSNDRLWNDEQGLGRKNEWTAADEEAQTQAQWDEFMRQVADGDHDDLMLDCFREIDYTDLVERIANVHYSQTMDKFQLAYELVGRAMVFSFLPAIINKVEDTEIRND